MSVYLNYPNTSNTYTITTGATTSASATYLLNNGVSTVSAVAQTNGNMLQVKGDANISGSLTVGGKDIAETLERIEERLAILRPNEELEEKWENLRGLRKMYMELEAEIIEKEKIWGILKK